MVNQSHRSNHASIENRLLHRIVPFLFLLFILIYLLPLGVRPLIIPDETRYAEIPREMIQTGEWIVPHLNGLRYFEKPVLGYWIEAGAQRLLGPNRYAARLPSALSAGLTAWLLFLLVRRETRKESTAALTSLVYLTFAEVFLLGGFNTLDGPFTLFITGCLVTLFLARRTQSPAVRLRMLILSGVCCGLAFLTKGFLALAFPVLTLLPFLIWERDFKGLRTLPGIPLLAALGVALPWCIAIFIKEPDFWRYFFVQEHLHRFFSGETKHAQPIWFFLPVLLAGSLPWTAFFPAAFSGLRKKKELRELQRFALCWFLVPLLFLSLSQGKLATYILPCYPPLAVLLALGLTERSVSEGKAFPLGAGFFALLTGLFTILLFTPQGMEHLFPHLSSDFGAPLNRILAGAVMALASIFFYRSVRRPSQSQRILSAALAPALFLGSLSCLLSGNILPAKAPVTFLREELRNLEAKTVLVSESVLAPALCWYFARRDIFLMEKAGEFAYGLTYPDAKGRSISLKTFNDFLQQNGGPGSVLLILRGQTYDHWDTRLPEPKSLKRGNGFVIAEYPPVRVGRTETKDSGNKTDSMPNPKITESSSSGQTQTTYIL